MWIVWASENYIMTVFRSQQSGGQSNGRSSQPSRHVSSSKVPAGWRSWAAPALRTSYVSNLPWKNQGSENMYFNMGKEVMVVILAARLCFFSLSHTHITFINILKIKKKSIYSYKQALLPHHFGYTTLGHRIWKLEIGTLRKTNQFLWQSF